MAKDNLVDLIYIIGNKADIANQGYQRKVTQAEAQEYAEKNGAAYAEVSAREHDGIEAIFDEFAKALPNTSASGHKPLKLGDFDPLEPKKKCSCFGKSQTLMNE